MDRPITPVAGPSFSPLPGLVVDRRHSVPFVRSGRRPTTSSAARPGDFPRGQRPLQAAPWIPVDPQGPPVAAWARLWAWEADPVAGVTWSIAGAVSGRGARHPAAQACSSPPPSWVGLLRHFGCTASSASRRVSTLALLSPDQVSVLQAPQHQSGAWQIGQAKGVLRRASAALGCTGVARRRIRGGARRRSRGPRPGPDPRLVVARGRRPLWRPPRAIRPPSSVRYETDGHCGLRRRPRRSAGVVMAVPPLGTPRPNGRDRQPTPGQGSGL